MISPFCLERPGPFKSCPVSFIPSTSYFSNYMYEWEYQDWEHSLDNHESHSYYLQGSNYIHSYGFYNCMVNSLCSVGPELPFLQGPEPPSHLLDYSIEDLMTP